MINHHLIEEAHPQQNKVAVHHDDEESFGSDDDDYTPTEARSAPTDEKAQVKQYSAEETKDVWTWKSLVIMLVVVAGGFAAAACTTFVSQVQQDEFEVAYHHAALEVSHGVHERHTTLVNALESMARWIVVTSQQHRQQPSFAAVMNDGDNHSALFDLAAEPILNIPGVTHLLYTPFIDMSGSLIMASIAHSSQQELVQAQFHQLVEAVNKTHDTLMTTAKETDANQPPRALIMTPVLINENEKDVLVGVLHAQVEWQGILSTFLLNETKQENTEVVAVLRSSCANDTLHTYRVQPDQVAYDSLGDGHDPAYDDQHVFTTFYEFQSDETTPFVPGHCFYSFHLYPTRAMHDNYEDSFPTHVTIAVAVVFGAVAMAFLVYDHFVGKRQNKIIHAAARSQAIVASVFPAAVRDRIMEEQDKLRTSVSNRGKLKDLMHQGLDIQEDEEQYETFNSKPIADLFTDVTIMFADISGFTAWSSTREPTQVFTLLETIYARFDAVAKKRRVYKVETVGDCYVAATGLPDPRPDHAVVMARFARDCMRCMNQAVEKLEVSLGPDTTDLKIRVGMHSGQVTAGVLRGDRSRFQLFGDSMNLASRMETTGLPGFVQISQATADILAKHGKAAWFTARDEAVLVKGKGHLQTYWLNLLTAVASGGSSSSSDHSSSEMAGNANITETLREQTDRKTKRLVQWAVDIMKKVLVEIAKRRASKRTQRRLKQTATEGSIYTKKCVEDGKGTVLDEVQEIIRMPHFSGSSCADGDIGKVALDDKVAEQLEKYVLSISAMYNLNAFHNFEHAMHVTNSTIKLLGRIVSPEIDTAGYDSAAMLHDHTYGITSDPLTQFACVFSALIHDVDHQGVPNTRLVVENPTLARFYKDRSVAEQNSVDLSLSLLQDASFADLQRAIYETPEEQMRFRQLVINAVMATDIADKDLKVLRNQRWDKAFNTQLHHSSSSESPKDAIDRKATIVIEHLIQASDIAHTMQHWHVYRKWNERLFVEMLSAFKAGRAEKDPSTFWYEGEIGFFDYYIIPLAKKLKECGVFGVSSDEYLNYALNNRREWESRGREITAEMMQKYA